MLNNANRGATCCKQSHVRQRRRGKSVVYCPHRANEAPIIHVMSSWTWVSPSGRSYALKGPPRSGRHPTPRATEPTIALVERSADFNHAEFLGPAPGALHPPQQSAPRTARRNEPATPSPEPFATTSPKKSTSLSTNCFSQQTCRQQSLATRMCRSKCTVHCHNEVSAGAKSPQRRTQRRRFWLTASSIPKHRWTGAG